MIFFSFVFYLWEDLFYFFDIWDEEDDQDMEDLQIFHAYSHGDEFVEYQFESFHRIIYDTNDLNILLFSNVDKSKSSGFFFKKLKKIK